MMAKVARSPPDTHPTHTSVALVHPSPMASIPKRSNHALRLEPASDGDTPAMANATPNGTDRTLAAIRRVRFGTTSVSLSGGIAQVQRDVLHTQVQLGAFPAGHSMHGRQRRAQLVGRNRLFRAPPLESRLGLRHAVFDCLHAPDPGKRRPCTGPIGFDDRVRIHEHRSPAVEDSVQRSITCSTRWTANSSSRPSIGNPTSTAARRTDT